MSDRNSQPQGEEKLSKGQRLRRNRAARKQAGGGGEGEPVRSNLAASLNRTASPAAQTEATSPPPSSGAAATQPQPPKVKALPVLDFKLPAELVVGDKISLESIQATAAPPVALKLLFGGKPVPQIVFSAGGKQTFSITWDATEDLLPGPGPKGDVTVTVELPIRTVRCPATFTCTYGEKLDLAVIGVSADGEKDLPLTSNLPADGIIDAGPFEAVFTAAAVNGLWRANTGRTTITVERAPRKIEYKIPGEVILFDTALTAEHTFGATATAGPDKPQLATPPGGKADKVGDAFQIVLSLAKNKNYADAAESFTIPVKPRPRAIDYRLPAAPVEWGTPLTAALFSVSASDGPDSPVLSEPAGGVTTTSAKALKVVLTLPHREGYEDVAPVTFTMPIEKQTPTLTWDSTTATLQTGGSPDNTVCTAVILPATLAAKVEYVPAKGKAFNKAGQRLFSAMFAGDEQYRAVGPVSKRLIVGSAKTLAGSNAMKGANIGANWVGKPTGGDWGRKIREWDNDTGNLKSNAKSIMAAIKTMTRDKMIAYLDALPSVSKNSANMIWKLPNGLQVRIKMTGDEHISGAVVIMEAVTTPGFSYEQKNVAFKVSAEGEATPKGPGQLKEASGTKIEKTDFKNGAMDMNHIQIMPKPPQPIEWDLPNRATVFREDPGIKDTVLTAKAAGAITYWIGKVQITDVIRLPGAQNLDARAAATDDLEAASVRREINTVMRPGGR